MTIFGSALPLSKRIPFTSNIARYYAIFCHLPRTRTSPHLSPSSCSSDEGHVQQYFIQHLVHAIRTSSTQFLQRNDQVYTFPSFLPMYRNALSTVHVSRVYQTIRLEACSHDKLKFSNPCKRILVGTCER